MLGFGVQAPCVHGPTLEAQCRRAIDTCAGKAGQSKRSGCNASPQFNGIIHDGLE